MPDGSLRVGRAFEGVFETGGCLGGERSAVGQAPEPAAAGFESLLGGSAGDVRAGAGWRS